ncbi:hypothetical protein ACFSY7_11225 [Kurthia populi]|uniref:Uncharacterized protein n=1 Tax=Kurthia populi TaxID=1562132 RepID=A0ABW5Y154_9BACL
MEKAIIHFADGEQIEVIEGQIFTGKHSHYSKEYQEYRPIDNKIYKLWSHIDVGLIPSILEIVFNSDFFHEVDNVKIIYSSKAITRIENL